MPLEIHPFFVYKIYMSRLEARTSIAQTLITDISRLRRLQDQNPKIHTELLQREIFRDLSMEISKENGNGIKPH